MKQKSLGVLLILMCSVGIFAQDTIECIDKKGKDMLDKTLYPTEEFPVGDVERIYGFDTYIKPDASILGKPPLPHIIKERHNWDDIPRFMNFHKNTSGKGDYTEEEITLLAKHDLVQIAPPGDGSTGNPQFIKRLGPPQGPAKKTGPFSYTREFKYASVVLDVSLRKGEITWR